MNKEEELKRLHGIVFEGAPDWAKWAAMDDDGLWNWFDMEAQDRSGHWGAGRCMWLDCKNQPETDLDWTETLLSRNNEQQNEL